MPSTERLGGGYLGENDLDMPSNAVGISTFHPRSDAVMDIATVARPRFMW